MSCPCGSGLAYAGCCEPLHRGAPAPTAESLMRSRFSAYALGLDAYLRSSWAAEHRPARIDAVAGRVWRRLQIVDTVAGGDGDETGIVEFRASFREADGAAGVQHERSRFVREGGGRDGSPRGRWVYLDGVASQL